MVEVPQQNAWKVRAGNENDLPEEFEEQGVVAIGWNAMGDVSESQRRAEFKERYKEVRCTPITQSIVGPSMPGRFTDLCARCEKGTTCLPTSSPAGNY